MSTAFWTAVGCTVAGAAIGGMLPAIGHKIAHGGGLGPNRVVNGRARWVHPVMASVTTAVFLGLLGYRHHDPVLVAWCWLTVTGVCLACVDIDCRRLPRILVGLMAGGGLLVFMILATVDARIGSLMTALVAATVALVAVAMIALAAPGQLGGGDITLLPVLALYLGWCGWSTVVRGVVAGALLTGAVAVVLVLSGRAGRGTRFAAGPTLILGALVAIAVGVDTGAT